MRIKKGIIAIVLCLTAVGSRAQSAAEAADPGDAERQQAFELYQQHKMPEAAALLEKVVTKDPTDVAAHEALGVALLSRAATAGDSQAARADRLYARKELLRAQELGDASDLSKTLLAQIPDTGEITPLSENPEADAILQTGEAAFAKGDWEQAIAAYTKAWNLEHSARAALYLGDAYFAMKDMDRAGEWFARSIEANPDIETAYRYWGDALMAQGRSKDARAKYIEGVVADPYQETSIAGLRKWLTKNHLEFKEIPIKLPPGPSVDKNGSTTIDVDTSMLDKPDVIVAWLAYSSERGEWQKERFLKTFPQEKSYRHSLAEEVDALQSVLLIYQAVSADKPRKKDRSLELLSEFAREGFLEPFVLLTHPDAGIVHDYPAYRAAHRDKLREFLDRYLVPRAR